MPKANPSGSQQGQHLFSPQQYPEVDMNFSFQQPLQLGKPGAPSGTAGGPCGTPGGPSGTAGGLFSTLGGPKGTTGGPTGTAGVLFGTPGGPSGTPGGLFGTPGGSKGTAGGLFGTPGGSKGTTGGLFGTPGGSKGTAGGLFSTPGGSKGTAGGLFGTPGGPSGTAGGLFSTLGGPKGTSGGLFGTPEGPSGTPGGLFGTPGGSKGTPGGLFGTPGGSKGTAGGPFGTPGGPSCTAGGPLGTPGGQVRSPPSQPVGEGDLTKNFNSITLNPPPPGENRGQQRTKGIELHLSSQYEEKVRPCLDLIDSLRALGVEQDLDLPAIAVIGDQSSGKSSVLEALSGVALPRGSGIVTRCPLVLKLRKVSSELQWKGKISYQNSELQLRDPSQVEREILKAQNSIAGHGVGISHELISLEISSSDVPDLTLIDLPGITRIAVGDQPTDIGMQIKTLIRKYIQKQQTINLVVVPCNVDIATTEALSMAQEVDPDGDRTIGILTKPDLVDKGAEKIIVNVVQNLTYHLKKGYMIVKCRGQQEIIDKLSLAEATKKEKAFFQAHPYFRSLLQEGKATVPCLAERLTTELVSHITKSLPLLENQIRENHQSAMEELCHCGENVPSNDTDKMIFLVEKIKMFNQDIEKLVEGEEIVKETETRLFNKLREEFKNWGFILGNNTQQVKNVIHEETSKYENQYRGKELLGFINYKTFETIVRQYVEQLVDPALSMLTKITELTWQTFADTAKKHFDEFSNLNRAALNKIEDIKTKQAEMAVDMIRLQFRMEKLVYCQDQIYSSILQKIREENYNPLRTAPQAQESSISALTEIGLHLNSYFWETSKRLSNQIPFIIQYCMLQENGDLLQKAMMQLLQEKEQYSWLLQERSETAHKRRILKEKIYRLTQARQALIKLSC